MLLLLLPVVTVGVGTGGHLRAGGAAGRQSDVLQLRLVEPLKDIVAAVDVGDTCGCLRVPVGLVLDC